MIDVIKMKTILKVRAFSIAEAILALFITALCIEMLIGILGIVKKADKQVAPINEVAFSYIQLKEFLNDEGHVEIDTIHSNSHQIILKKQIGEKDKHPIFRNYCIEEYRNMIRLTGADGGHMPLIMNLRKSSFKYDKEYFEIYLQESDRRNSVLRFKTDKPIELKDKTKNDKDTLQPNKKGNAKTKS